MNSITWSRPGAIHKASVDVCVVVGDMVNVSYSNKEMGFSGQLKFRARRGAQRADGTWKWDGDKPWKAAIDGEVTRLTGEQFEFEGSWDENDGALWDLYVECPLSKPRAAAK